MKTNVFKKAHEITKKIIRKGDSYRETFRLALIFVYSQIKKGVNKMLNKKEIMEFNCEDTSKVFDSVMGKIWYEKNWGWRVELKEPRGAFVREDLSTIKKELKAEELGCSIDDICFSNGIPTLRKKKEVKVEKEIKVESVKTTNSSTVDFEDRCWECGCKLDKNGECPVCDCSKEIRQF